MCYFLCVSICVICLSPVANQCGYLQQEGGKLLKLDMVQQAQVFFPTQLGASSASCCEINMLDLNWLI